MQKSISYSYSKFFKINTFSQLNKNLIRLATVEHPLEQIRTSNPQDCGPISTYTIAVLNKLMFKPTLIYVVIVYISEQKFGIKRPGIFSLFRLH